MAVDGEAEAGARQMRDGIDAWRVTGAEYLMPYFLALLAGAAAGTDRLEEALGLLAEALDRVDRSGERWLEAELHRRRGEILLRLGDQDAKTHLRRAIQVAQSQGARFWELRAALPLCRALCRNGRHEEAGALLAPLHAGFGEGLAMPDLVEASSILDEARRVGSAAAK
jgi:predicted ATPase